MESGLYSGLMKRSPHWQKNVEENGETKTFLSFPSILQPQTPKESMEFLARSWSLSAKEVSKALGQKQKKQFLLDKNPSMIQEIATLQQPSKVMDSDHGRRPGTIGKWFHDREFNNGSVMKKKDKARAENARIHASVSVAGLAAALAAVVAAAENSKMGIAMASATELLASHCVDIAELAGAGHDRVASIVRSAVDIRSPGDLMTLTAAAATALRGETTLRARLPKEARKNAAISPHDKSMAEEDSNAALRSKMKDRSSPCKGKLLQKTRRGVLHGKSVSVSINKKSQVIIKLKSKYVGGAFTKNKKCKLTLCWIPAYILCVVYEVCGEAAAWPFKIEREIMEEVYFGLKTAQGFLEFKCKSKIHKQKWVEEIRILLLRVGSIEATTHSLEFLTVK